MMDELATWENQVAAVKPEAEVRREKMDVMVTQEKRGEGTRGMEELPWHFDLLFPARQRWLIATQDPAQRKKLRQGLSRFLRRFPVAHRRISQTFLAREGVRYPGW
jgi:hypothetical protein